MTHIGHEWVILGNLLGLLVGFALLVQHFHDSRAPELLPNFLPDDWKGGFVDRGMLPYTVGFGGSMIWFGSSAGVALSNSFPEARSVGSWLRHGWHVAVAYVLGFFVLLAVVGWQPGATRDAPVSTSSGVCGRASDCVAPGVRVADCAPKWPIFLLAPKSPG